MAAHTLFNPITRRRTVPLRVFRYNGKVSVHPEFNGCVFDGNSVR